MRQESELSGPANSRFLLIREVNETGSTNADLLKAASEGAKEGLVLCAKHQSAGRGRQGRPWLDTPSSSLLVSFLLRPNPDHLTLLPLLTGIAVSEALHDLCKVDVGLKWPNDVLSRPDPARAVEERKLVGILAEATSGPSGMAVVVGFGMNLSFPNGVPPELATVATDLATLMGSEPPERMELLRAILLKVEALLQLLATQGPERLLERYRSVCLTLGREVEMATPTGVISGLAVDIAPDGGLVLQNAAGLQTVTAGDTHHVGGWGRPKD